MNTHFPLQEKSMPLTELKRLIDRFKSQKDSTPISLPDTSSRAYAVQELLSLCTEHLSIFMYFDNNGESALFDALADDETSLKMAGFLDNGRVSITTNDTAVAKKLPFIEKLSPEAAQRINFSPIPKKLAKSYSDSQVDNEFMLASPEHLIFFGHYSSAKTQLSQPRVFLTFFDQEFFNLLNTFLAKTNSRAAQGEFK